MLTAVGAHVLGRRCLVLMFHDLLPKLPLAHFNHLSHGRGNSQEECYAPLDFVSVQELGCTEWIGFDCFDVSNPLCESKRAVVEFG